MTHARLTERIQAKLRQIEDHPLPGITFQDITPVLQDGALFRQVTGALGEAFLGESITHVAGIEARGFILASPVAVALGAGFIPLRKPGKLPWTTLRHDYDLEYGQDALEAHTDACPAGSRVLIVDDVLATGGTAAAAGRLIESAGGLVVGWAFLLAIRGLGGRQRLGPAPVRVLLEP